MNNKKANTKANFIILTITIFAASLIFGFSENIKGPAIPQMQLDFSMSELQVGLLLAINSLGYLIACFYTAAMANKIGLKLTLIICLIGMALSGIGICISSSFAILAASYFAMYLGNGMLEVTLGIMSAVIFTKNTGTMMNLSHFFYGLSSCIAPLLSVRLMNASLGGYTLGWRYMYLFVLAWSIVPIMPLAFGKIQKQVKKDVISGYLSFLKNRTSWYIIGILSLGVTGEMAVGGWLVNFLEKTYHYSENSAAIALTSFFVCFTLARLCLGPLTDKIGFIKSLLIFSGFSGVSIIVGVLMGKTGVSLLIAAGFGIAPIYPTVMAVLAKLFNKNIESALTMTLTVMGIVVVVSNFMIGGMVDLFKQIFAGFGDSAVGMAYKAGYIFIGLCCVGSFFVTLMLFRQLKRKNELV